MTRPRLVMAAMGFVVGGFGLVVALASNGWRIPSAVGAAGSIGSLGVGVAIVLVWRYVEAIQQRQRLGRIADELRALGDGEQVSAEARRLAEFREFSKKGAEAEAAVARYLPDNMRRAKRLTNHLRLMRLIAYECGLFDEGSAITLAHLTKWVVLSERWPRLATKLAVDPDLMAGLESTNNVNGLNNLLSPSVLATAELHGFLREGPPLAEVMEGLVRLEPVLSGP